MTGNIITICFLQYTENMHTCDKTLQHSKHWFFNNNLCVFISQLVQALFSWLDRSNLMRSSTIVVSFFTIFS